MSNESISIVDHEGLMAKLQASAEREMSAFVAAVNQLFDAEQGRKAANNWIQALEQADLPGSKSVINWRKVTIAAAVRLVTLRKATAPQARSKRDVPRGSAPIAREKRSRCKPSKRWP